MGAIYKSGSDSNNNGPNLFHSVPREVLSFIVLFLDIPSIGNLAQTCKAENDSISQIVSSDKTWLHIVNSRFNTFPSGKSMSSCRPKLYGGPTWKDAFRSMSVCNRIPKMRVLFKKKNIFAKGAGYSMQNDSTNDLSNTGFTEGIDSASYPTTATSKKRQNQFISTWVMINHTEDCNLRSTSLDVDGIRQRHLDFSGITRHMMNNNSNNNHHQTRTNRNSNRTRTRTTPYIELQLAFQNTKSGFCTVNVDVLKTTVQMMCDNEQDNGSILTQRIIRHGPLKPRIIHRSAGNQVLYQEHGIKNRRTCAHLTTYGDQGRILYHNDHGASTAKRSKSFHSLTNLASSPITLKPFEFVVISVCVPMTHYIDREENVRFETDFLSRAISICTPVSLHAESTRTCTGTGTQKAEQQTELNNKMISSSLSVATFSPEHEIWENYTHLPGNCLALTDRNTFSSV